MRTTTPDQMDRVLDEHFAYEAAHDLEGVMTTFTDDAELDVVGFPAGPRRGKQEIRDFYEQLYKLLDQEEARPLHRYHGEEFMIDETIWSGQFDGVLVGAEGHRDHVTFRLLHVIEFRDGLVAREKAPRSGRCDQPPGRAARGKGSEVPSSCLGSVRPGFRGL